LPADAAYSHDPQQQGADRACARFVERNFLTREVLLKKLKDIQVGRRFAAWLGHPKTAALIANSVAAALPGGNRARGRHPGADDQLSGGRQRSIRF
jgi:hypothetical protein